MPVHIKNKDIPRPADRSNTVTDDIQQELNRFISWINQKTAPASDADNIAGFTRSQIPPGFQVHLGVIHYTIPCYGGYRVCLFGLGGLIRCRDGRGAFGGGETEVKSLLPPGTYVYVLVQEHSSSIGTIIGVKPQPQVEANDAFSDFIVQGSGVGLYSLPYYADYVSGTVDGAGAKPYTGDYPIDGLSGDYTIMSTTGVGLHVDDEMAFLRTSELCGVFLFREDGYTRVTGEQLALESLSVRSEMGMVAYETYEQTGHTIYPWEVLGQPQLSQTFERMLYGPQAVYDGATAVVEPARPDAIPIERITEYGGYLGQGQLTVLATPVGENLNTLSQPTDMRGLFRQQVMLDGTYLVESARQLFFAKAFAVPTLRRKHARDYYPEGTEYRFSGAAGEGDDHVVRPLIQPDSATAAMNATEAYAYAAAWQGLNAAVYNPNIDLIYVDPQGGATLQQGPAGSSSPLNVNLDQNDRVTPASVDFVSVDHRYGQVDIHKLLSLFAILPDGSIVIRNGLGAEIKLTQGVVEIAGTGIYMNSARTCSILAGQVAIRGNRSVELVSSHDDVRLKGERNVNILGGNSGRGGVLIESRGIGRDVNWTRGGNTLQQSGGQSESEASGSVTSPQFGGIVLKAANSYVAAFGGDVVIRSGTTEAGLLPGSVVIDAPQSVLTVRAPIIHRYTQIAYDHFTNYGNEVEGTNTYAKNFTVLSGSLGVNEQIVGRGGLQLQDSMVSLNGYFGSPLAPAYQYMVGTVEDPGRIADALRIVREEEQKAREQGSNNLTSYERDYRESPKFVSNEAIQRTSFSFPSSEDYRATGAQLTQPYWQQIVPPTRVWNEPVVRYGRSETRPWPGQQRHTEDGSYIEAVPGEGYFDPQTQQPIDPQTNRQKYEEAAASNAAKTGNILEHLKIIE